MPKAERLSENEQLAVERRFEGNCEIICQSEHLFGGLLNIIVDCSSEFLFWKESKKLCLRAERHLFLEFQTGVVFLEQLKNAIFTFQYSIVKIAYLNYWTQFSHRRRSHCIEVCFDMGCQLDNITRTECH